MRLTRIASTALLAIVLISTVACGSSSNSNPTATPTYTVAPTTTPAPTFTSGFTTYINTSRGFSVSVPNSWEMPSLIETGSWTYFVPPSLCAEREVSVSVTTVNSYSADLQAAYSEVLEPLQETLPNYSLISKENLTIDSVPAIKVIYTYVNEGSTIKRMECYFIKELLIRWLLAECAATCWDTYENIFNTMMNSFQVLD